MACKNHGWSAVQTAILDTCDTVCYTVLRMEGSPDGKVRKPWRLPAKTTRAGSTADIPRNRENHRRKTAAEGAASSGLVEQQSFQQRDDQGLAQCRLRKRAGGHGSAQAGVSP